VQLFWTVAYIVGDGGMEQTKIESLIETSTDMTAAFIVSWMVMLWLIPILFPGYVSKAEAGAAFGVVMVFTVTSFIRRYLTRRFFARGFLLGIHCIQYQFPVYHLQ